MRSWPKVTFGIIVFNGQPFITYCLRALYPYAHQIVVVEGAAPAAAGLATSDGHSTDGTMASLYRFKAQEDPHDKLEIVVRDGSWSEKDEQSQAYAQRATGDYLWQIDVDEFYQRQDMERVLEMLQSDPSISAVSFRQKSFWGGFDKVVDGWYLRAGGDTFWRLFRWGPGFEYVSHRPPSVVDNLGRLLNDENPLHGRDLARKGILLYHYSLVFPRQVRDKVHYYSRADWSGSPKMEEWAENNYFRLQNPYRVHNVYRYPSWLESYAGEHPPQIECLRQDIAQGEIEIELRPTGDVDALLRSPWYRIGRGALRILSLPVSVALRLIRWSRR